MNNTKNKSKIFLIITFSIIILASITITIFANQIFKLKGRKFLNLLTKEQYIMSKLDVYKNEFLSNGENSFDVTIKNYYLRQLLDFLNFNKIKLSYGDIILNANIKSDEENLYSTITLNNKKTELIKDNKNIALKIDDISNEYLIFENQNIEKEVKKILNLSGEKTSIKDAEKFLRKYTDLIVNQINDDVEVKENEKITINNEEYEINQYILTLDTNKFNNICKEILNKLKEDDESLTLLTNKYNDFINFQNNFLNSNAEELTKEELKQNINSLIEDINTSQNGNDVLKIVLSEYEEENIKTEIDILTGKFVLIIETIEKDEKDYMNFNIKRNNKEFAIKYTGEKNNNTYEGKFNIVSIFNPQIVKLKMERLDSKTEVRKIDELNPNIKVNEITKEKLIEINNNIRNKFGIAEKIEYLDTTGIFKIKKPKNNNEIIENSKLAYTRINPIMTTEEVIKIMGNPSKIESGDDGEILYWIQGENIELISVKAKGIKIYNVYNDVAQSEKYKADLANIWGEDKNINDLKKYINTEMSKEEVVNILGENYIEVSKSNLGYTRFRWFDKNENFVEIEFDENGKIDEF